MKFRMMGWRSFQTEMHTFHREKLVKQAFFYMIPPKKAVQLHPKGEWY